jgi:hypothetical protein
LQRDTNKVNKKYEKKIRKQDPGLNDHNYRRAAAKDGGEIPPPLHRNFILLSKNEIKTIISTPKVWCCEKNSPWEFKL